MLKTDIQEVLCYTENSELQELAATGGGRKQTATTDSKKRLDVIMDKKSVNGC